ncbi:RNA polymerase II-associated protein 1 isoform X1 [Neodiprion virginianus]|uniref:RNA polymerase II-associated protein 1 isoform X1 n=2 Tax=Neodiprion virginianus TaxID=2961670 RepID=UPI001EE76B51|nr:RNA polymerase II-associated protein 1 isoform X1 [Neodiprion virginianus]
MEPVSLKRPKPGDGEEELFHMQEEFLKSKHEPAAKVINLRQQNRVPIIQTHENPVRKPRSVFAECRRNRYQGKEKTTSQSNSDVLNTQVSEAAIHDNVVQTTVESASNTTTLLSNILLGNIIEKKFAKVFETESCDTLPLNTSATGFPKVFVSEKMLRVEVPNSTNSLFQQQVNKSIQPSNTVNPLDAELHTLSSTNNSVLVEGPWATEIHTANLQRLNNMTKEEIMKEKMILYSTLDPMTIEYIKNRKQKKLQDKEIVGSMQEEMEVVPCKSDTGASFGQQYETASKYHEQVFSEEDDTNIPKPSAEIIQQVEEKGWLHMDRIESEKLKWMEEMPATSNTTQPEEPYNARFDFNGMLLPFTDENLTVDKGLHHHGEEPERPGYSLQELLQLSRSSTQQQRCMALNTLGNIMEKSRKGWYDQALQPPPLPTLNERNIFLLLRFSLDDSSVAIVTATLQALRSFLFSEADEICLDRLMGLGDYKEPCLTVPPTDVKNISILQDHELAQLDTVAAALRSDIILRIRYILSEMRPPPPGVTAALEILARLARYSHEAAVSIASTPQLLGTITQHFIPLTTDRLVSEDAVNDVYGVPVLAAIRFCRILVCYGGRLVAENLYFYKVLNSLLSYITGHSGKHSINLCIESLRLWKMLLLRGVGLESVGGAQFTILSQLQNLLSNHDIGPASELACEHAAALITVAGFEPSLRSHLSTLLSKWSTQLATVPSPTWASTKLVAMTLMSAGDISLMKPLLISQGSNIFSTLCSSSNLLSGLVQITERDPSSLPNLGVLGHEGQLLPAVSYNSCIPFLATVLSVLSKSLCKAEIQTILNQPQFKKYINKLESIDWSLERSWYTRMELSLVTQIVRCGTLLGDELNSEMRESIWKLSIKLISALPADAPLYAREMVRTALSREKLQVALLVNDLDKLKFTQTVIEVNLDLPENLVRLYEYFIKCNGSWDQPALPKDWLYLPLVDLYSKCRNDYDYCGFKHVTYYCSADDGRLIAIIFSLELTLPELVEHLSPSVRYSRLLLAYLCDTLFLDQNVSPLLTKTISCLVKRYYKELNFNTEVPGLSSFTDMFTTLCEHFSATSYGNEGFGMTLLVPLAQRHDVHYRKLLWSEHAGALRSLRTPLEMLPMPLQEYLYPVEEDISLIECYLTALAKGIVRREWCPVMYTVALHHTAMNLKEDKSKISMKFKPRVEKLGNIELKKELLNYIPPEY